MVTTFPLTMWEIHTSDQLLTFGYALILGAIFCVLYDFLSAHRIANRCGAVTVFIADLAFWIVAAFTTFLFLLARTKGEIRGYVLVAELIGFVIFRLTFSKLLFAVLLAFFKTLARINTFFSDVFERLADFVNEISQKTLKILKRVEKKIKKLLKSIGGLLYTKRNYVKVEEEDDGDKEES